MRRMFKLAWPSKFCEILRLKKKSGILPRESTEPPKAMNPGDEVKRVPLVPTQTCRCSSHAINQDELSNLFASEAPRAFRGGVEVLWSILKLGIDVPEARTPAFQFVELALAFYKSFSKPNDDDNRFWPNLQEMRDLIHDTAVWAHRTFHNPDDRNEVRRKVLEYKQKLGLEVGSLIGSTDSCSIVILESIRRLLTDLEKAMPDYNGQSPSQAGSYKAQEKASCYPRTREKVLKEIKDWASNITEESHSFLWLTGDAGVGESAIAVSIAEWCQKEGILWSQFFFDRNNDITTAPLIFLRCVFLDIADCLAGITGVRTLRWDPYDKISPQAMDKLPKILQFAAAASPNKPIVIIIDALDVCQTATKEETAEIFTKILPDVPKNVKILISTRVEDTMRPEFDELQSRGTHIHVSRQSSVEDVALFLNAKVRTILENMKVEESLWGQSRMDELCCRASGLFIWAVEAICYIEAQIKESGRDCIPTILDKLDTVEIMKDIVEQYLRSP